MGKYSDMLEVQPSKKASSNNKYSGMIGKEPAPKQQSADRTGTSTARTILDQTLQAMTGNLGDEISGAVGGFIAPALAKLQGSKAFDDATNPDIMQMGVDRAQQNIRNQQEQNPVTSILSNLAGGVGMGGIAAGAVKGVAPNAASNLTRFAKANPLTTAGGVSGVSGTVYGAGGGEGSLLERGKGALIGGAVGAFAGPVASSIGRNVIAPAVNKLSENKTVQSGLARTAKFFDKKGTTGKPLATTGDDFTPELTTKDGSYFPMTEGQITQNPAMQRLENDALAGTLTKSSESNMRDALAVQNKSYQSFISKMAGGLDKGKDINALVEGAADVVKQGAKDAKIGINSAYDLAREGKGVAISSGDIRKGLWSNIAGIRREGQYDLTQMPRAKSVLKRLASYSKRDKLSKISAVKLGEMENFRKQATNALNDLKADPKSGSEANFMKGVINSYDNFMEQTAKDAVDIGDADAIRAFKDAVGKRAEYGRLFEKNKFVNDIVKGEQSVDDVVKTLIGTGSIKGKKSMANNLDALLKAAKGESDVVQSDLKQAFMKKVFDRSVIGFEANNPSVQRLSPAKLATELENIFVSQSKFAEKLYGKEAVTAANQAIKQLNLISSAQSNTRNASGSGEWVGRFMQNRFLNNIPVFGQFMGLTSKAMEAQKQNVSGGAVEKGLKEFFNDIAPPSSTLWSTVAPVGTAAALGGVIEKPELEQTLD